MTNAQGVDISTFETSTPPLAGLDFVVIRASYGTTADPRYAQHYADCRAGAVWTMAYHFGYSGAGIPTPAAQAAFFIGVAHAADYLWLDLESSGYPMTQADAAAFIAAVHAAGRHCGLYHSASGYPDVGEDARWVALWGPNPPNVPWTFWQNADTYLGTGADGDHDYFNGDSAALAAWIGGTMNAPTGSAVKIYAPGYTATLNPGAKVRNAPDASVSTNVRRVVGAAGEAWGAPWAATGQLIGVGGSLWYFRLYAGEWEYAAVTDVPSFTPPSDAAAILAAEQKQWDTDSVSIVATASAKLSNPRPT